MLSQIKDKNGETIQEGDEVFTPIRGGIRQGTVETIVTNEEQAKQHDVKHPPKVIFTDQHGHEVAHNPETLQHRK